MHEKRFLHFSSDLDLMLTQPFTGVRSNFPENINLLAHSNFE